MGVLIDRDIIIGTGCYDGNHITGVYVLPNQQKQGCGSKIMDCLEAALILPVALFNAEDAFMPRNLLFIVY